MAQPNFEGFGVPMFKTWGRKRHLSCMNSRNGRAASSSAAVWDVPRDSDVGKPSLPLEDGFESIRMKLMSHLRDAADKFNLTAPQRPRETDADDVRAMVIAEAPPPASSTGKLQRRRRSNNRPLWDPSPSPPPTQTRSLRPRSVARAEKEQLRDRKLSVSLSREEVDEDFYALTGRRASGRPKRHPPAVRKHLELLFPGLGLLEITAGSYEVAEPRVRSRGL